MLLQVIFPMSSGMTCTSRPIRYRHRATGVPLESVFASFWTFEGDRPVRLSEYHDIGRIQAFANTVAAVEASRSAIV
jgi:ketosteroid isomerase-like protein